MRRTLLAFALCCVAFRADAIGISTLGSHHQTGSATNIFTTATNDCPTGSVAAIFVTMSAGTVSSIGTSGNLDSVGNTWVIHPVVTATGVNAQWVYARSLIDIAIGTTVTVNLSSSTTSNISGACVTVTNTLDIGSGTAVTNQNTNGPPSASLSSGTPAGSVNEGILGGLAGSVAWTSPTCTGTLTTQLSSTNTVPPQELCTLGTTSAKTLIGSWTTGTNYVQEIIGFQQYTTTSTVGLGLRGSQ